MHLGGTALDHRSLCKRLCSESFRGWWEPSGRLFVGAKLLPFINRWDAIFELLYWSATMIQVNETFVKFCKTCGGCNHQFDIARCHRDIIEVQKTAPNKQMDAITLWREYFEALETDEVAAFLFHNADRINAVLA